MLNMVYTFTVIMSMCINLGQYGIHLTVIMFAYTNYVEYGVYLHSNFEHVH